MRYGKLGGSDLEASEISPGSWMRLSGGVEFEQIWVCTEAAFDAGTDLTSATPLKIDGV